MRGLITLSCQRQLNLAQRQAETAPPFLGLGLDNKDNKI